MAHDKAEYAGPAIAGAKKQVIELPRKWWQWVIAVVLTIVVVIALLFVTGMHTGRIGFVPVEGNSMQSVFPWGTAVFVLPVKPRDGDYVVAWAIDDDPETQEDKRPELVVKKLDSGQLVSTDINQTYKSFEIRGMVIGQLPIQKVCWWMDKGGQNASPGFSQPDPRSVEIVKNREEGRQITFATRLARLRTETREVKVIDREMTYYFPAAKELRISFEKSRVVAVAYEVEGPRPAKLVLGNEEIVLSGMTVTSISSQDKISEVKIVIEALPPPMKDRVTIRMLSVFIG